MFRRRFVCGTLLVVAGFATGGLRDASGAATRVPASTPAVQAPSAIQHPIEVHVTALDPVQRGATVRVRVEAASRIDLEKAEVRLVSAGGAALAGAPRAGLGRLRPGRPASREFAVRLPAQGHRFLLQFRVTGEGTQGVASRGATLNLLPDGPADPGRIVDAANGERVIEHRARRIDR
jgi:hypothetical protein